MVIDALTQTKTMKFLNCTKDFSRWKPKQSLLSSGVSLYPYILELNPHAVHFNAKDALAMENMTNYYYYLKQQILLLWVVSFDAEDAYCTFKTYKQNKVDYSCSWVLI